MSWGAVPSTRSSSGLVASDRNGDASLQRSSPSSERRRPAFHRRARPPEVGRRRLPNGAIRLKVCQSPGHVWGTLARGTQRRRRSRGLLNSRGGRLSRRVAIVTKGRSTHGGRIFSSTSNSKTEQSQRLVVRLGDRDRGGRDGCVLVECLAAGTAARSAGPGTACGTAGGFGGR